MVERSVKSVGGKMRSHLQMDSVSRGLDAGLSRRSNAISADSDSPATI